MLTFCALGEDEGVGGVLKPLKCKQILKKNHEQMNNERMDEWMTVKTCNDCQNFVGEQNKTRLFKCKFTASIIG